MRTQLIVTESGSRAAQPAERTLEADGQHRRDNGAEVAAAASTCPHRWVYGGRASTPHPRCERPELLRCAACGATQVRRCRRASRVKCRPCAETYRHNVARVMRSGLRDDEPGQFFVTLTAPGEQQHSLPNGEVCPCTPPGGVELAWWNSTVGRRWSEFMIYLRRMVGDVQYVKAAECQRRGAIHFHALVRCAANLMRRKSEIRALAIAFGFGHSIDIRRIASAEIVSYCAKYASKSVDERAACPWLDRETGEVTGAMRVRTWTCSRRWGSSMRAVRASQAAWWVGRTQPAEPAEPPLDSSGLCSTTVVGCGVVVIPVDPFGAVS